MSSENQILSNEVSEFFKIEKFNEKKENIIHMMQHKNQRVVVTCEINFDWKGRIDNLIFRIYILAWYKDTFISSKPISKMICDAVYNDELDFLDRLFIRDFVTIPKYQNSGYGSIIMTQLIKYSKQHDFPKISGELSCFDMEDKNNNDRLHHFYPKFGFIVTEDERIYLDLKKQN